MAQNIPINITEVLNLQELGCNPADIVFNKTTLESDKYIVVLSEVPQKSVAYVDVSNCQIERTPMNVDAAIMNPTTKVMAVRSGKALQVSNLDMKKKIAWFNMPYTVDIVFWKWVDSNTIAFVTNNAVYHWSMEGGNPKKLFDRRQELQGGQIINYGVSKDGKMCFLQAIKKVGQGIGGIIQYFDVKKNGSQIFPGHAAAFGMININGRKGEVFVCVDRIAGQNGMLRIKEIGGTFTVPPKEVVFPPNCPADFPICLTVDEKHDLAFMVSKMGNVFMFDLLSGITLFRKPLSSKPFIATQNTQNGGMLCIMEGGVVLSISLNEKNLVPFIMEVLHNQELAKSISSRLGLPCDDNIFKNQLEELFKSGNVRGIAELAARSPGTTVRNQETINRLKSMPRGADGSSPPSVYFQTLLGMAKLNEIETIEFSSPLVLNGKVAMIEKFLKEDKITPSEVLGDLIAPHDARVALQVYFKGNAHEKVINCFLQLNDFGKIQEYVEKTGCDANYVFLVSQMVRVNPEQAAEFAIKAWEKKGKSIDVLRVIEPFVNVGAIRECNKFLFKVLEGDKPEDGPLQTKLLELNLHAGISQVVDTIFSNKMFSHYDRVSIAHLCEEAGLAQRALEHYTDLEDIRRVIADPRLMSTVNQEFIIQFLSNMSSENRMECLKDLLLYNINSVQLVVKVAQKCSVEEAQQFIELLEENDESCQGLYNYLGSILHKSEDPEVHYKYIKAAVKLYHIKEAERVCRESDVYKPEEVRDFLLSVDMPDPKPIITVCDRFGYIEEMTGYLFQHQLMKFLEIYVRKENSQNTPRVIGKLLDLNAPEFVIKNLLNAAKGKYSDEKLIEEVRKRNKLELIIPYCPAIANAAVEKNIDPFYENIEDNNVNNNIDPFFDNIKDNNYVTYDEDELLSYNYPVNPDYINLNKNNDKLLFTWLNNHRYELMNDNIFENKLPKIRDLSDNSFKLLKVVDVSDLDQSVVNNVVNTMKRINDANIPGIMKYKIMEMNENLFYRISRVYKVHLNEINPLKYFEDIGPFEVLNGILNVLKSLEENGTIHSDLKPSNIFMNNENEVIINDYLNNLLYKGREAMKQDRNRKDLCFVCIDELIGKELDISSDIWNFGLIFYYIKSGKYPFVGSNILETMKKIENIKYTPLECESGEELNSFLRKILQKEKKDRLKLNEIMSELKKLNEAELPVIPFQEEEIKFDDFFA